MTLHAGDGAGVVDGIVDDEDAHGRGTLAAPLG
jgi:hypothetical protein